MSFPEIIENVSVYSVVLPLLVGLPVFLQLPSILKGFVVFLLIGWMVDLGSYHFPDNRIYNFYSVIEACFFLSFLFWIIKGKIRSPWLLFWMAMYVAFFLIHHVYFMQDPGFLKSDSVFTSSIKIINSFLAAGSVVTMNYRGDSLLDSGYFWFTIGIFFYCFGTYFLFSFLNSDLYKSLWWIHNSINILTNCIFAFAFLVWAGKISPFQNRSSKPGA